jgi:hypothetical protein
MDEDQMTDRNGYFVHPTAVVDEPVSIGVARRSGTSATPWATS